MGTNSRSNNSLDEFVVCIYCHGKGNFGTVSQQPFGHYVKHLVSDHRILFDLKNVVERTLTLHKSEKTGRKENEVESTEPMQVESENEEESMHVEDVNEEESTESKHVEGENGSERKKVAKVKLYPLKSRQVQWYLGCEYRCQYGTCSVMFYDENSLIEHVATVHGSVAQQYLKQFDVFLTRKEVLECKVCENIMHRSYNSVLDHVKLHGLTLKRYAEKFKLNKTYTVHYEQKNKQNITFIEWANKCVIQCKVCLKEWKSFPQFKEHLNIEHKMNTVRYSKVYGTLFDKNVLHTCLVCSQNILLVQSHLCSHIWKKHNISVETYYRKHILNEQMETTECRTIEQNENITCDYAYDDDDINSDVVVEQTNKPIYKMEQNVEHFDHEDNLEQNDEHEDKLEQKLDHEENMFEPMFEHEQSAEQILEHGQNVEHCSKPHHVVWMNKCVYKCRLCPYKTKSRYDFIQLHIIIEHLFTQTDYMNKFGRLESVIIEHKCHICDKLVRHDGMFLKCHLTQSHNMTVLQYYQQFFVEQMETNFEQTNKTEHHPTNKEQTNKNDCESQKTNKSEIEQSNRTEIEQTNKNDESEQTNKHDEQTNNSFEQTNKLSKIEQINKNKMWPKMDKMNTFDRWRYKCEYSCQMCSNYRTNKQIAFKCHVEKKHGISKKRYISKFGSFETASAFHTCMICDKSVLHDGLALYGHMKHHKWRIEDYHKKFILLNNCEQTKTSTDKFDEWKQGCEYKCQLCSYVDKKRYSFITHVKNVHKMNREQYLNKFQTWETLQTFHTCKICGSEILHDACVIESHTVRKHFVRLRTYYNEHIVRDNEQNSTTLANVKIYYEEWKNNCYYKCANCSYGTKSRKTFMDHVEVNHQISVEQYLRKNGQQNLETKTNFHGCKLCQQCVLHDYFFLSNHMKKLHDNERLPVYYLKHVHKTTSEQPEQMVFVQEQKQDNIEQETPEDPLNVPSNENEQHFIKRETIEQISNMENFPNFSH